MLTQWRAISARIHGLVEAAELQARYRSTDSAEDGSSRYLRDQCKDILAQLRVFRDSRQLPTDAVKAIEHILKFQSALAQDGGGLMVQYTRQALVELRAFESEVTYLLTDNQERIRSVAERAFQHLRRQIVVDADVRAKWQGAYDIDEVACERLGAVHLLSHGIFAFKVHADGARTDLVFGEQVPSAVAEYAEGLVLTEWKVAGDQKEATKRLFEAQRQAESYAEGPLAMIELRDYRYLVVVTPKQVTLPPDMIGDRFTYRCVNIPVDPDAPSVAARKTPRRGNRNSPRGELPARSPRAR